MTETTGVCVVTHPLSAAGENATRTLLDILSGITSVSLVTADLPEDSTIWDHYNVVEVTNKGAGQSNVLTAALRFLRNQIRMCQAIAGSDEDTVLFFGATSYLLPVLFSQLIGKTVVLEPRGDVPLTLRLNWERTLPTVVARTLAKCVWALERTCYHLADAIITYTPEMAAELELDDFQSKLFAHGARYVDTELFAVQEPYAERDRVVGFVGRLDEEKNVRTLARAAQYLPKDVTFRFIGDGPLRGELEATAGDSPHIEFAGWVDHNNIPAELNQLQLLVLPSHPTEGLPTTILESLACGTPVLSTPVSGVPDAVRDGETGFHLHKETSDDVADAIRDALSCSDLERMSIASRQLIENEYSYTAAVERYQHILKRLRDAGS
ncbi:glycosyl transferase family 1 [Halorubrum sp. C191]|uniref:glycosyltransferase family 4 protein n=1 Tax=Halorubrum sp. C191 TaxID=1383842 RepID=UPI000B99715C|nr:glycosyltransferase [Halorubrum sp. C191]OYR82586.1 glycosyl transferase family 1 [Halorubrum ezzemoulense]PHQ40745.1 glycosyl transferase family 1 [Halorubrum sp. C191]